MDTLKELYVNGQTVINAILSLYESLFETTLYEFLQGILVGSGAGMSEFLQNLLTNVLTFLLNDTFGIGSMTMFTFLLSTGIGIWISLSIIKWFIGIVM